MNTGWPPMLGNFFDKQFSILTSAKNRNFDILGTYRKTPDPNKTNRLDNRR